MTSLDADQLARLMHEAYSEWSEANGHPAVKAIPDGQPPGLYDELPEKKKDAYRTVASSILNRLRITV